MFFLKRAIKSPMNPYFSNHTQKTNIISCLFIQSILRSEYYTTFLASPQLVLNCLPNHVEIMASTHQCVLLCYAYNKPHYYMCKLDTKQLQIIQNLKIRYHSQGVCLKVMRSSPLHYKIVRFLKLNFYCHKEFYMYHYIICELFDSKTC